MPYTLNWPVFSSSGLRGLSVSSRSSAASTVPAGRQHHGVHVSEAVVDRPPHQIERPAPAAVFGRLGVAAILQVAPRRDLVAPGHLREERLVPRVRLSTQVHVARGG
jgi:hypothetical protein